MDEEKHQIDIKVNASKKQSYEDLLKDLYSAKNYIEQLITEIENHIADRYDP